MSNLVNEFNDYRTKMNEVVPLLFRIQEGRRSIGKSWQIQRGKYIGICGFQ
jgi:hypothetical protein